MKTPPVDFNENQIQELIREIQCLKDLLQQKNEITINPDWIPWKRISQFFDYGDTQMAQLETKYNLVVAKVGKRKFVHRQSLADLLDRSTNRFKPIA